MIIIQDMTGAALPVADADAEEVQEQWPLPTVRLALLSPGAEAPPGWQGAVVHGPTETAAVLTGLLARFGWPADDAIVIAEPGSPTALVADALGLPLKEPGGVTNGQQ